MIFKTPNTIIIFIIHSYLLTLLRRVLIEKLPSLQLVKLHSLQLVLKLPYFMEPEGSLPNSQVPTNCLYPEPAQFSPHTTSHLLKIHLNIIHPSTPRSPKWSLSSRFPHQDPIRPPLLTHSRHMPSPSHSSRLYHPHNIGRGVQIIYLLVMQSPLVPRYLVPPVIQVESWLTNKKIRLASPANFDTPTKAVSFFLPVPSDRCLRYCLEVSQQPLPFAFPLTRTL